MLDNGGGSIKAGLVALNSSGDKLTPFVATNALARPGPNAASDKAGTSKRPQGFLVCNEIDTAPDFTAMSFRRPHDRGYVTRWDVQRDVWASLFSSDKGIGLSDPSTTKLLLTEPIAAPLHMRRATDELVFETFGFCEYAAVPPSRLVAEDGRARLGLNAYAPGACTALVLDSGFSFTHAVPVIAGLEQCVCSRRLNIGGKALTNHLKQMVSFRSWNMMEETAVVNAVKERLCFVSGNYLQDLAFTRDNKESQLVRDYVLPDLSRNGADPLGHVKDEAEEMDGSEQILSMHNERMSVPEVLFNPLDVGLEQAGVAELIVQAVEAAPGHHRADLYANVLLAGGNSIISNFRERLVADLRPLVPDMYELCVNMDEKPALSAFNGGVLAMRNEESANVLDFVSKAEYEEYGSNITIERFQA